MRLMRWSRTRATWAALCAVVALDAIPQTAERITPSKFAELTMKMVSSNSALSTRRRGPIEIVVVGSQESANVPVKEIAAALGARLTLVPASCTAEAFELTRGIVAVVAVDLPYSCVKNLSRVARQNKIFTISTKKEDVDPLSLAIVIERGLIQIYRSDVALTEEGIGLSRGAIAATRSVTSTDYRENYREAIRAIDFKNWNEAARRLRSAIDKKSQEGGMILIYGVRNETYLPHYFLGVALYNQGQCSEAMVEWDKSLDQGAIHKSRELKKLQGYRVSCAGK